MKKGLIAICALALVLPTLACHAFAEETITTDTAYLRNFISGLWEAAGDNGMPTPERAAITRPINIGLDTDGNAIQAIDEQDLRYFNGKYYLYGQSFSYGTFHYASGTRQWAVTPTTPKSFYRYGGTAVYTSDDLMNWTYEGTLFNENEYLSPYVITDEDGTQVDTGEKRILLPTLAVMEQGKVVSAQTLVYTLDEGQSVYDPLRPEQYDELYNMISAQMIGNVTSERPQEENAVMYFYSQSCWECAEMKPFVQGLIANNPSLNIEMYCIEEEPEIWEEACMQAGIPVWGVPRMFVGDMCFVGWSPKSDELIYYPQYYGYFGNKNQILNALQQYSQVPLVLDEAMD